MSTTEKFDAENADNMEEIEKQFAVKAVEQMQTYWNLLEAIPGSKLRLTPFDAEIYEEFIKVFPEYSDVNKVAVISEDEMKSKEGKEKWRALFKTFEKKVEDYNFGTLIRVDASEEYTQENSIFGVRLQFYAVEIARNKHGLNDWACKKSS
ncbi:DEKNAAC101561 [Brettanomyces naardenensis]|uniref:Protein PBDC1 homolog n=1 Tax=Brettanomyces naardenensis TaxID=13370 RepID=A0A448YIH4_BRENA|nr:DEKNAAC101561 [Brettanomyces naardenensis]